MEFPHGLLINKNIDSTIENVDFIDRKENVGAERLVAEMVVLTVLTYQCGRIKIFNKSGT